jgi:hypothetical protein
MNGRDCLRIVTSIGRRLQCWTFGFCSGGLVGKVINMSRSVIWICLCVGPVCARAFVLNITNQHFATPHSFHDVFALPEVVCLTSTLSSVVIQGVSKRALQLWKAYRNLYRGHTQRFELSKCSKTHRVLPRTVIRNCFDLFFRFLLHGTSTVTSTPKSSGPYRSHNNDHYAHD